MNGSGTAGSAAGSTGGDPTVADDNPGGTVIETIQPPEVEPDEPGPPWGSGVLALAAVAWLAATLWSAHATIGVSPDAGPFALTRAALALPGVIGASLLAGAATGLATVEMLSRRVETIRARVLAGMATGIGAGLAVGVLAAGSILLVYGVDSSVVVIAVAIAAAGAIGGVPAAARPAAVVGAGLAGMLAWYAVGLLQGLYSGPLLRLFGAGDTIRSQFDATNRLSFAVALLGGVLVGLVAYRYLYRRDERRWPAYLIAGVAPGVLILLTEVVTLVGGARLLELAGSVSTYDRFAMRTLGLFRIKTGLLVLFAGGVVAIVAFGRSLPVPPPDAAVAESGTRSAHESPADPVNADPVGADPVNTDPVNTGPVDADPVGADGRHRSPPMSGPADPGASREPDPERRPPTPQSGGD